MKKVVVKRYLGRYLYVTSMYVELLGLGEHPLCLALLAGLAEHRPDSFTLRTLYLSARYWDRKFMLSPYYSNPLPSLTPDLMTSL